MDHDIHITSRHITVGMHSEQPSNHPPNEAAFFTEAAAKLDEIASWLRKLAKTTK